MKRFLAMIMSLTLVFALTSCGNSGAESSESPKSEASAGAEETSEENAPAEDSDAETEESEAPDDNADDTSVAPLDMLNTIWNSYGEDEKFPSAGGDMSEENMSMEGPGKFSTADTESLNAQLGFPAASADKIDDAASLVHMLNGNTFTCGAYHLKNTDDADALVSEIKDNIMNRQWICGFPEKLVIVKAGDCVVSFFGTNDIVAAFKDKLTAAYPSAEIAVEEEI